MSAAKFIGLLLLVVIVVGSIGIFYAMASAANTQPFEDSYGGVQSNQSNSTQDATTSLVTATPNVGVGVIFVLGGIALITILIFAAAIFTSNRNGGRY